MTIQPKAVFFDWDGTLVDSLPWLLTAHNHVRVHMGHEPWSAGEFKEHILFSSNDVYNRIYGGRAREALDVLHAYTDEHHIANIKVHSGAKELLEGIAARNIVTGIVSNKRHEALLREVSHLGWDRYTNICIGAGFAPKDKPAPDPLLLALKETGCEPGENIWYIGDSETDMLTARAAGCSPVLIRHGHENAHLEEKYNPLFLLNNCESFFKTFQKG